jgi:antitoxin VapB
MAPQIAKASVVAKVEQLAKASGLTKTAAVERAVDLMLGEMPSQPESHQHMNLMALLVQLDQIPDRKDAFDPLMWDENGLPT